MTLSQQQLLDIQAECLADDVAIHAAAASWTEAQARRYFESGGLELPPRLPHIVCLHGTASNADIMSVQLGKLKMKLKGLCTLTFIDGPRLVDEANPQAPMMHRFFGQQQVLREFAVVDTDARGWRTYVELEPALQHLEATLDRRCAWAKGGGSLHHPYAQAAAAPAAVRALAARVRGAARHMRGARDPHPFAAQARAGRRAHWLLAGRQRGERRGRGTAPGGSSRLPRATR